MSVLHESQINCKKKKANLKGKKFNIKFFFCRTECEGLDVCIGPLIKYSGKYLYDE